MYFEEVVNLLVQGDGIIQCSDGELAGQIQSLLVDATRRDSLSKAGRDVIKAQQGATGRYEELIVEHTPNA